MKRNSSSSLLRHNFYNFFQITMIYTVVLFILMFIILYLISASSNKNLQNNAKTEIGTTIVATTNLYDNIRSILSSSTELKGLSKINFDIVTDVDMYNLTSPFVKQLKYLSLNNTYINSCFIYFVKNDTVLTTKGFDSTHNNSKYLWHYADIKTDYLNNFIWSRKTGNYITIYSVLDIEDPSTGIMIVTLDLNRLINTFDSILENTGGSFALFNTKSNDIFISASGFKKDYIKKSLDSENSTNILNNKVSFDYYEINNFDWCYVFAYDNFVTIKQTIGTTLLILSLTFIFLILISLILSYYKAKKMQRPINDIINFLNSANDDSLETIDLISDYSEIRYIIENIQNVFLTKSQLKDISKEYNTLKQYSLQLQIQPHFLYNTLEMIYLESYELLGDNNSVSEMIYNLSTILNYSFRDPDRMVNLTDEVNMSKSYLLIQGLRFENQFDVIWDISVDTDEILTPKIILQPILENAINHGIIPTKRKCTIHITINTDDNVAIFTIEDDGVGINPEKLEKINETLNESQPVKTKHLGILNVDSRIKLMFGSDYGCSVSSVENKGTKVQIKIPKILDKNSATGDIV